MTVSPDNTRSPHTIIDIGTAAWKFGQVVGTGRSRFAVSHLNGPEYPVLGIRQR